MRIFDPILCRSRNVRIVAIAMWLAGTTLGAASAWAQTPPSSPAPSPAAEQPAETPAAPRYQNKPGENEIGVEEFQKRNLQPLPPGSPMPSADPRNFEGTWYHLQLLSFEHKTDMYGTPSPLNARGRKILARRIQSLHDGAPFINASAMCKPVGQPLQLEINSPWAVLQNKDWVQFLFYQHHGAWTIPLTPALLPKTGERNYDGKSIGHWDGDTLVVETSGYKDDLWLDANGMPISKDAKLTHRIRKIKEDTWQLEIVTTIDDPTYYDRPWSYAATYVWRPDKAKDLDREFDCEYQVNRPDYLPSSGLVPEHSE